MSWLRSMPLGQRPTRLQFVKAASSIQVRPSMPAFTDTEQLAKLADGIAAVREQLILKREASLQDRP